MAIYRTKFSARTNIYTYYFHYICEFCGKDSGNIPADFSGSHEIEVNTATLNDEKAREYRQLVYRVAHEELQKKIDDVKEKFSKEGIKGVFPEFVPENISKCKFCGNKQSWSLDTSRGTAFGNGLLGLMPAMLIIAAGAIIITEAAKEALWPVLFFMLFILAGVCIIIPIIFGFNTRAKNIKLIKSMKNKNVVEIIWPEMMK